MSHSKELKVSVVVQNRNNFALTYKAVDSVLSHTDTDVEIILVDNGSDSHDLVELKNKFKDTRVSLLSVGVNRFSGEGNNIGAESATGEILVFLNNQVMVS
jgi:GT2 family glycosyltransferase